MNRDSQETLEDLESEITCRICQKHLTEPKILSCLHCYCKDCLISLVQQTSPGESISCPQCQYKTILPNGDARELKTAGHKMYSIADLRKGRADSIPVEEPLPMCHSHNQSLDYYCYNCKHCICRHCSLEKEDHEQHQYDKNSVVTSKIKEKLKNELEPMKELHQKLKNAMIEIQEAKDHIKTEEESNIQQLSDSFDELDKILQKRKQELVDRAKELAQKKIDKVLFQEKKLSLASTEVQSVVNFTERCTDQCSDSEIISLSDIIVNRMDQMKKDQDKTKKALKIDPQGDVIVEAACAKDLKELSHSLVFVTEQVCQEHAVEIVNEGTAIVKCEVCYELTSTKKAFSRRISRILCPSCADRDVILLDTSPTIQPPNVNCQVHVHHPLKYFCIDHKICICDQCQVGSGEHKNHNLEDLETAAKQERDKLNKINLLPGLHKRLKNTLIDINVVKHKIKDQEKLVIGSLRDSYRDLRKILLCSEQVHVEKVQIKSYEYLERLLAQEKKLSSADNNIQSISNFIQECVNHLPDAEIMRLHTSLAERVEQELQKQYAMLLDENFEPVERADIGVTVPSKEALQYLCETEALIFEKIDPLKSSVDINKTADIGVPFTASLVTRLGNNRQAKRSCKVSSNIESLCDRVVTDCSIDEERVGQYKIQFTPIVRGCHRLTILINEQPVSGSPFSIFVSVSPDSLTKPVKVWNSIKKPFGGIMNSKREVLCIENYKRITQLTADGRINVLVPNCELQKLLSIACDDKDNIFGVDELSNKIFTCDQNGGNIRVREVKLVNGKGRSVINFFDNQLITIDRGETTDTLCMYSTELTLMSEIPLSNKVRDMSADTHGNLYATDSDNCCIIVYNKNGDDLQTLNLDKTCIQYPWGISTFRQYLYLTDCTNHSVVVFTTDGTFITSIGGRQETPLRYPYKVFVNADYFVYVFDFFNDRILCY